MSRIQVVPMSLSFRVAVALRECGDDCNLSASRLLEHSLNVLNCCHWRLVEERRGLALHMG